MVLLKIVVLGDMLELGDQEVQFHYEVGKLIDPAKSRMYSHTVD